MRQHSQLAISIAYSIFLVLLFVVIGGTVLLVANGYEVNWQARTISQTGAIVLAGHPGNSIVTLDGVVVEPHKSMTIRGVSIGPHSVQITAEKYQLWRLSARIEAGQAVIRDQIQLWLTTPTQLATQPASVADIPLIDPTLAIDGFELYQLQNDQRQLVTRFSQPPLAATRSNDRAHVFVQLGQTIYVTELNGENTTKLLTLSSATPTPLLPRENDSQLVLKNGDTVQVWQIR